MLDDQSVDWNHFDIKRWSSKLKYIKAVLNATNATNDIGKNKYMLSGHGE